MADAIRPTSTTAPAEPPGGGRQDHEVMRAAALRPVAGPASTDLRAAIGGVDVPGRESHPEMAARPPGSSHGGDAPGPAPAQDPIPGERDPSTLTHRDVGAVGGQFAGADIPAGGRRDWIDERTAREREREGGG